MWGYPMKTSNEKNKKPMWGNEILKGGNER